MSKNSLKIAVEFYGHLRSFRETAPNIKQNFINQLGDNVDIFIHTWNNSDTSEVSWHNKSGEVRGETIADNDLSFLKDNYAPKKISIDQPFSERLPKYKIKLSEVEVPLSSIESVFYTKYKVNELRKEYENETGAKYDFVIQARLDQYFFTPFNIEKFINYQTLKKNKLSIDLSNVIFYCADSNLYGNAAIPKLFCGTDVMYFGTPNAMDKFTSVYTKIKNIDLEKEFFSMECLLAEQGIKEGLTLARTNYIKDKDFGLLRTTGYFSFQSTKKKKFLKQVCRIKAANKNLTIKMLSMIDASIVDLTIGFFGYKVALSIGEKNKYKLLK